MRFLIGFCLLVSCGLAAHAATIHVNPFGTGDYPNIQAAITAASPGDTVALARGVYVGTGNRDVDFLGKQVVLRSIDGDPSGCVINSQGGSLYNHRAFVFTNGEGPGAMLEGLTIRGGLVSNGGAILCAAGACPSIRNCVVTGNTATMEGGGIAIFGGAHPTVVDCVFTGNHAQEGGGIGSPLYEAAGVTAVRCRFDGNDAGNHGGGVCFVGPSRFEDCTFSGNSGYSGGGFFHCGPGRTEFLRCTFVRNHGYIGGAGLT